MNETPQVIPSPTQSVPPRRPAAQKVEPVFHGETVKNFRFRLRRF
jgi:hypothetical protein